MDSIGKAWNDNAKAEDTEKSPALVAKFKTVVASTRSNWIYDSFPSALEGFFLHAAPGEREKIIDMTKDMIVSELENVRIVPPILDTLNARVVRWTGALMNVTEPADYSQTTVTALRDLSSAALSVATDIFSTATGSDQMPSRVASGLVHLAKSLTLAADKEAVKKHPVISGPKPFSIVG